jgi:AraC family transcriptional regulator
MSPMTTSASSLAVRSQQADGSRAVDTPPLRPRAACNHTSRLVQTELEWRVPPPPLAIDDGHRLRIRLARWTTRTGPLEISSDAADDWHALTLILRRTRQELHIAGEPAWRGGDGQNEMLLTGPRQCRWRGIMADDCDNLRVFFPQALLAECVAAVHGRRPTGSIHLVKASSIEDASLRQLAMIFKTIDTYQGIAGPCFADALALAFGIRLIELYHGMRGGVRDRPRAKLAPDQLSLVFDYIEAQIGQPIYLSDLSALLGLSRIRFAAEFKSTTGLSPYAYILRRRIARAQQMLGRMECSIVGIALDLGFSSQAHFAEAFRRIVGVTPGAWRKAPGCVLAHEPRAHTIGPSNLCNPAVDRLGHGGSARAVQIGKSR